MFCDVEFNNFEGTYFDLSYLSCEKVTRHDYITALVANGGAELSKHMRVCVWFYEAFLVWYASRLWLCMPGNPPEKAVLGTVCLQCICTFLFVCMRECLGGTDFTHDLI